MTRAARPMAPTLDQSVFPHTERNTPHHIDLHCGKCVRLNDNVANENTRIAEARAINFVTHSGTEQYAKESGNTTTVAAWVRVRLRDQEGEDIQPEDRVDENRFILTQPRLVRGAADKGSYCQDVKCKTCEWRLGVLYTKTEKGETNIAKLNMRKLGQPCILYYTAAGEFELDVQEEVVTKHIRYVNQSVQEKADIEQRLIKHKYATDKEEARRLMSRLGKNSHLLVAAFLRELEALDKVCREANECGGAYEELLKLEDFEGLNQKHAPDVMDRMMGYLKKWAHGTVKKDVIACVRRIYAHYQDLRKDQNVLPNRWIYYHMMDLSPGLVTIQEMRDDMGARAHPKEMLSLAVKWVGTCTPSPTTPEGVVNELQRVAAELGVPEARGMWLPAGAKGCEALSLVLKTCKTSSNFGYFLDLVDDEWAAPKEQLGYSYKYAYSKMIEIWEREPEQLSSWQPVCTRLSKIIDEAGPIPLILKAARIRAHHFVGPKVNTPTIPTINELLDELAAIEDNEDRISAAAEVVKMIKGTWPDQKMDNDMVHDMRQVFVKAVPQGIRLERKDSCFKVDVVHDIQTKKIDTPLLFFLALIHALDELHSKHPSTPVLVVTGRGKHATQQGKEFCAPDEIRSFLKAADVKCEKVHGNDGMLKLNAPRKYTITALERAIRRWPWQSQPSADWNGMNNRSTRAGATAGSSFDSCRPRPENSEQPARDWAKLRLMRRN